MLMGQLLAPNPVPEPWGVKVAQLVRPEDGPLLPISLVSPKNFTRESPGRSNPRLAIYFTKVPLAIYTVICLQGGAPQ